MKVTSKFVFFYGSSDHFSNFYKTSFTYHGTTFHCSEQFLMYCKAKSFNDDEIARAIMAESSPAKIKALGRKVQNFDDQKWKEMRETVAYIGLLEKYRQNDALKKQILDTGSRTLAEASPRDKIWGIGMSSSDPSVENVTKWQGSNILGKVLMRVREQLYAESIVGGLF